MSSNTEPESITLRLVEAVFNYPVLYDTKHKEHSDKTKKEEVWEEVARQVHLASFKVKKKWKNLRDSYLKFLKNQHNPSPDARNSGKNYAKWQWASQMEKFKPFLYNSDYKPRINKRFFPFPDQDLSSELDTTDVLHTVTKREPDPLEFLEESEEETEYQHGLLKQSLDAVQSSTDNCPPAKTRRTELLSDYAEAAECSRPNMAEELDVVDHLMLAYAKTIKRFSLRRQAETKMQIAQLILRQELEEIEERQEQGNISRFTQL